MREPIMESYEVLEFAVDENDNASREFQARAIATHQIMQMLNRRGMSKMDASLVLAAVGAIYAGMHR